MIKVLELSIPLLVRELMSYNLYTSGNGVPQLDGTRNCLSLNMNTRLKLSAIEHQYDRTKRLIVQLQWLFIAEMYTVIGSVF